MQEPDVQERTGPRGAHMTERTAAQEKHLLIVEDDADTGEMMQILLEAEGYRVRWALTGTTALKILTAAASEPSNGVDLMLLDLTLPDMDGVELVRKLRESDAALPPVIV